MTVLIAEDDEDQLFVRSLLLQQSGFETIEAADAGTAIEKAKTYRPECALIDLRLPKKESGLKLVRELKTLDPQMHVFILTGDAAAHFDGKPEGSLVDGVIVKGSSSRHLIQRLRALAGN